MRSLYVRYLPSKRLRLLCDSAVIPIHISNINIRSLTTTSVAISRSCLQNRRAFSRSTMEKPSIKDNDNDNSNSQSNFSQSTDFLSTNNLQTLKTFLQNRTPYIIPTKISPKLQPSPTPSPSSAAENVENDHDDPSIPTINIYATMGKAAPQRPNSNPNERSERKAAVLVPLCYDHGIPSVLFTVRSSKLRHHSSEVSFPGGMIDDGESDVVAALREMEEECGIAANDIEILGQLDQVRTLNRIPGTIITPICGFLRKDIQNLQFRLSEPEVAYIFTVPIATILTKEHRIKVKNYPAFQHKLTPAQLQFARMHAISSESLQENAEPVLIWGATCWITLQFMDNLLARFITK